MPFVNTALVPLVTNSGFTMWLYRTTDSRADALAPGYFEPAAGRLATGDIIVMLAADSMSFLPVRVGDVVAAGLVLDSSQAPFRVQIRGAQVFSVSQTATAVAMRSAPARRLFRYYVNIAATQPVVPLNLPANVPVNGRAAGCIALNRYLAPDPSSECPACARPDR